MAVSLQDTAQQFATALPHCKALNMRMDLVDDARAVMSMPYDEPLIGDPAVSAIHGGATAAFLETTAIIELVWAKIEGQKLSGAEIAAIPLPYKDG